MENKKYVAAIIVAGGKGKRMDSEIPKQYLNIAGRTILDTTLYKFEKSNEIDEIILVVNKEEMEYVKSGIPFNNILPVRSNLLESLREKFSFSINMVFTVLSFSCMVYLRILLNIKNS
jgi:2-C-methyl-D-erythritol 4-phosphate cytidylyltransferase